MTSRQAVYVTGRAFIHVAGRTGNFVSLLTAMVLFSTVAAIALLLFCEYFWYIVAGAVFLYFSYELGK